MPLFQSNSSCKTVNGTHYYMNGSSVRNRVFHIISFKTLYVNTMLMTEVILELFPLDYMFQAWRSYVVVYVINEGGYFDLIIVE